jgi:hypothetical protein
VWAFLRPTWLTWVVVLSPVALVPALSLLQFHATLFALYLLAIEIPFAAYHRLGLPVGRRGDWFGYAFPNGLGWTLIALTDLVALYLLASAASAVWARARHRGNGQRRWTGHRPEAGR